MPLVTAAYLALVAGLLAGFAGHAAALCALAALPLAAAVARRDARLAALALTAAAGALVATGVTSADHACRAALRGASALDVVLHDPAAPGRLARGHVIGAGCPLRATLRVARGRAPPGTHVHARGAVTIGERGALVRDASIADAGRSSALPRLRARAARAIDRLFGPDSAIVRALLVADARAIPPEVRDRYADAGLVHVLSVSGLHVAIVAAALELLLAAAGLSRRAASLASVLGVAAYVALLGAPAPAVRAAVMLGAGALSRALQRPTSPWAVLALGGLAPLVDPRQLLDIGYQLSVAGMAALVAGGALARQLLSRPEDRLYPREALRGWRRAVARELTIGVVATLVTAPVVAWHFGRLSVVGPLTNVLAAPIVAILQPTLFLALALAPLGAPASFVADAARPLLHALDAVAAGAAALPVSSLHVAPTLAVAALLGGAAVALLVACVARRPAPAGIVALACVAVGAWAPLAPPGGAGPVELHMIDVGQGDALAVRTPRGRWILFDAGRAWRGGDAGRRTVIPYLRRHGGELAALVLSHPHADHVGGASSVIHALRPPRLVDAAFALGSDVYRGVLLAAREAGVRWERVRPGESLVVDGVSVDFLAPDSAWTASLADPNLASVVASVAYGRVRFLLVGDAEAPEERWLLDRARRDPRLAELLRADVLKVGHHGSATSSIPEFVDAVRPRVALVSVGADNDYGHPSRAVVDRLAASGAEVLRSDLLGAVVVRTDGRSLTVEAGGESWEPSPPVVSPAVSPPGQGGRSPS